MKSTVRMRLTVAFLGLLSVGSLASLFILAVLSRNIAELKRIMTRCRILATLMAFWSVPISAQTIADLVHDGRNPENVTTQSLGFDRKSYSPLKQITSTNIKRLVPIWSTSVMNDLGELAAPTVYNGVMYVINGKMDVRPGH